MRVEFQIVQSHPLAKGLSAGRFYAAPGEDVGDALVRKIARAATVAVTACAVERAEGSLPTHYRLTLCQERSSPWSGGHREGEILVKIVEPRTGGAGAV